MTVVDTTVWIDYLGGVDNPHTQWLDQRLGTQSLALTDLNLCEILQGLRDSDVTRVCRFLLPFTLFTTGGEELAVASARNYRFLRSRGCTVRKTIDTLIATHCLLRSNSLLHRNRDFDYFEQHLGLEVIHP